MQWALGVITYEFLYGFPPFHASTPQEVFDNIISRRIDWHEEEEDIEYSPEARAIMERLMTTEITHRLGYNGADEVKSHPWLVEVEWDKVTTTEAQFVPQVTDPESTDYFDARGALPQIFQDDEPQAADTPEDQPVTPSGGAGPSAARPIPISKEGSISQPPDDEFGAFSYKNLPVLKQANDDVIRKMRTDQMAPMTYTLSDPTPQQQQQQHNRRRSVSQKIKKPLNLESRVAVSRDMRVLKLRCLFWLSVNVAKRFDKSPITFYVHFIDRVIPVSRKHTTIDSGQQHERTRATSIRVWGSGAFQVEPPRYRRRQTKLNAQPTENVVYIEPGHECAIAPTTRRGPMDGRTQSDFSSPVSTSERCA
ncbi:serine/threonine-protein kinase RIM15 [Rhizoctonia solani AG-1 IB]|uniref:non-specific serine/threonine protein kinase n=1 Tax=Thanatephorus cucumeris (strain AG1-IB / isolate 7/3/14) TaxID=1108050 RepID=M5C434_THACB|nr:serine/threonine-protein kinase RIM15 [Rhizoctonia solani AG-1 IB]